MSEECGSCEYNRQCFTKKNVGIFECEKEIVTYLSEEEIKELIEQVGYKEFYRYYKEKNKLIEDLQQKVEQLEKDKSYANWYAVKKEKKVEQLENIRKEAIESIERGYVVFCKQDEECLLNFRKNMLNILNKGSENNETN